MSDNEVRRYRVEMEVQRVGLPKGRTSWRTLKVCDNYTEVGDLADYLVDSMELAGITREQAATWVMTRLRVRQMTTTTMHGDAETLPIGP